MLEVILLCRQLNQDPQYSIDLTLLLFESQRLLLVVMEAFRLLAPILTASIFNLSEFIDMRLNFG